MESCQDGPCPWCVGWQCDDIRTLWSRFSSLRKLLVGCEQGVPGVHFGAGAVHGDGMIDGEVIEILCGNTTVYYSTI